MAFGLPRPRRFQSTIVNDLINEGDALLFGPYARRLRVAHGAGPLAIQHEHLSELGPRTANPHGEFAA